MKNYLHLKYTVPSWLPSCLPLSGLSHSTPNQSPSRTRKPNEQWVMTKVLFYFSTSKYNLQWKSITHTPLGKKVNVFGKRSVNLRLGTSTNVVIACLVQKANKNHNKNDNGLNLLHALTTCQKLFSALPHVILTKDKSSLSRRYCYCPLFTSSW